MRKAIVFLAIIAVFIATIGYCSDNDQYLYLDNIYGVYGDLVDGIHVFPGKDRNHIDIMYCERGNELDIVKDIFISDRKGGLCAPKKLNGNEFFRATELRVTICDNTITLKPINPSDEVGGSGWHPDENGNMEMVCHKTSKVMPLEAKLSCLEQVINYKYIDSDVFYIKETNNYIILEFKPYFICKRNINDPIYRKHNLKYKYVDPDEDMINSGTIYISKKNNSIISLKSMLNNSNENLEKLNSFIKDEILKKKEKWKNITSSGSVMSDELWDLMFADYDRQLITPWNINHWLLTLHSLEWPFEEFESIDNNSFFIDEIKQVVIICCVKGTKHVCLHEPVYPTLYINVPFSMFSNIE